MKKKGTGLKIIIFFSKFSKLECEREEIEKRIKEKDEKLSKIQNKMKELKNVVNSMSPLFNAKKFEAIKSKIDKFLEKNHHEEFFETNNIIFRFLREFLEREDSSRSEKVIEMEK